MNFRSSKVALGLVLAALALFALQPWSHFQGHISGAVALPLLILVTCAAASCASQVFPRSGMLAAVTAGVATGLFGWGNAYASAAMNNTIGGPLPWWSEVAMVHIILGFVAAFSSAFLALFLATTGHSKTQKHF